MKIGQYSFDGPYTKDSLIDKSGIYAIVCYHDKKFNLIDVGESATVKTRITNHDRKDCWFCKCAGDLIIFVLYTPNKQQAGRKAIEQELRNQYKPPCGEK